MALDSQAKLLKPWIEGVSGVPPVPAAERLELPVERYKGI
jgi:hypothetical protein